MELIEVDPFQTGLHPYPTADVGISRDTFEPMFKLPSSIDIVCRVSRLWFCQLFGIIEYNKSGHFVDKEMTLIIHMFFQLYPDGNQVFEWRQNVVSVLEMVSNGRIMAISADGGCLFTPGEGRHSVIEWDLSTLTQQGEYHLCDAFTTVQCLAFENDYLSIGMSSGVICIMNAKSHELYQQWMAHTVSVSSMDFFADTADFLLSGSMDSHIKLWLTSNGECLRIFHDWVQSPTQRALFVYQNQLKSDDQFKNLSVLSGSMDGRIRLWDCHSAKCVFTAEADSSVPWYHAGYFSNLNDVSMNCDCSLFASSALSQLQVWHFDSVTREITLSFVIAEYSGKVCFHPFKPDILAVICMNDRLRLYNLSSYQCVCEFHGHFNFIMDLVFTPDGSRLISISYDRTVRVWEINPILYIVDMVWSDQCAKIVSKRISNYYKL